MIFTQSHHLINNADQVCVHAHTHCNKEITKYEGKKKRKTQPEIETLMSVLVAL